VAAAGPGAVGHAYRVSIASQPDARADAIEVYLGRPGEGTLARAFTAAGPQAAGPLQRVTGAVLRGGLTTWVHVGMTVRRLRGRADPLRGLGRRETFLALCRLAQAAVEGTPVPGYPDDDPRAGAHVRLLTTPYRADEALSRLQQVLRPYAAAGTVTPTGRAVIAWFAIRHLIEARSGAYSLQVVHLTPEAGRPCQVSLMLPYGTDARDADVGAKVPPGGTTTGDADGPRRRRRDRRPRAGTGSPDPGAASGSRVDTSPLGIPLAPGTPPPARPAQPAAPPGPGAAVQEYLDTYREHLTRELLLEPVVGPEAGFAWTPEPTGDGGAAVGGTVPAAVPDQVVLRMAAQAVTQLGRGTPGAGGEPLGPPEADGDLLVQRWTAGPGGAFVLSVAARSGDRRRPTQVLIHVGPAPGRDGAPAAPRPDVPALELPHQVPTSGPDVDDARALTMLPLWWHSAGARCDGNDVILYEMPFRGRILRVRANDYPAEPMYTLLVGEPGREVAAVDLENWPSSWTRPRV